MLCSPKTCRWHALSPSAVTMASSLSFVLLACIMKLQHPSKHCITLHNSVLLQSPLKGEAIFCPCPLLGADVTYPIMLVSPTLVPLQMLSEVRLGLLMYCSYFKCKTKETLFVLNAETSPVHFSNCWGAVGLIFISVANMEQAKPHRFEVCVSLWI